MMTIVDREKGSALVEIARKNWEDQSEYRMDQWKVVHEGSPIVLLKKKHGTDDYQEFRLFDLELTNMLLERHPGDYKIIDYQKAQIQPVVKINRDLLGTPYKQYFHLEEVKKSSTQTLRSAPVVSSVKSSTVEKAIDEEFEQISKELAEMESFAINQDFLNVKKTEGVIKKKWNLDRIMLFFVMLLLTQGAFIAGYYYRSSFDVPMTAFQMVLFGTLVLLAGCGGYYLKVLIERIKSD